MFSPVSETLMKYFSYLVSNIRVWKKGNRAQGKSTKSCVLNSLSSSHVTMSFHKHLLQIHKKVFRNCFPSNTAYSVSNLLNSLQQIYFTFTSANPKYTKPLMKFVAKHSKLQKFYRIVKWYSCLALSFVVFMYFLELHQFSFLNSQA